MAQNYYTLKRMASQIIDKALKYLEENPSCIVSVSLLTIKFQQELGFSKRTLLSMLDPFEQTKDIKIVGDEIIWTRTK